MGEIAEMMMDGTLCEGCGVFLNEEAPGYPCQCRSCASDTKSITTRERIQAHEQRQAASKKVPCPTCGKRVKTAGLADHQRDAHSASTNPNKEAP